MLVTASSTMTNLTVWKTGGRFRAHAEIHLNEAHVSVSHTCTTIWKNRVHNLLPWTYRIFRGLFSGFQIVGTCQMDMSHRDTTDDMHLGRCPDAYLLAVRSPPRVSRFSARPGKWVPATGRHLGSQTSVRSFEPCYIAARGRPQYCTVHW